MNLTFFWSSFSYLEKEGDAETKRLLNPHPLLKNFLCILKLSWPRQSDSAATSLLQGDKTNSLELPLLRTASTAALLSAPAFIFSGQSPLKDIAITFPNSSESATEFAPSQTRTATPMSSTNSLAFTNWSASIGQPNISTPAVTLLSTIARLTTIHNGL
ncbi:uncharacterized protein LOC111449308 [Cucurbita moschata]|uniref:Uncharacterized protein LOC111449308 n=1 Tax=Cucurbita moschata TaxID=3662 RepID=A0A6J1FZE4_CUCMO|nr:uncharacterized protein LOC111449308 [Cucurbita moschata]